MSQKGILHEKKLQEFALFAEIIGAAAIVVSLLFVGIQVQQSNSIATTDAIQTGTQLWVDAFEEAWGTERQISSGLG